jgi:molybdate transport system ATP-binding protein
VNGLRVSVTKRLPGFTLDAHWEMGRELAVLLGCSGSGKSLTLRTIAGLLVPDSGRILCGDAVLWDPARTVDIPPQDRSIGYLFQNLALFPHMSVQENILFGGHGMREDERRERAGDLINRYHLRGLERRLPSEISGGQQQRVALARALLRKPRALLLDEPFSALDAPLRRDMRSLLKDAQREYRVPVVLVTHDQQEALSIADRIIVYARGRVVQAGAPDDLLREPGSSDVSDLIGHAAGDGERHLQACSLRRWSNEMGAGMRSCKAAFCLPVCRAGRFPPRRFHEQ